jgi:alpha-1,6-mannosyltransferase
MERKMSNVRGVANGFMTQRYLIASSLLVLVMVSHTLHGRWIGDFWEHSAVVRELSTHPLQPQHPLLNVSAAHPFFSPYSLAVGIFARLFSLTSIDALAIAGILNLLLLLFGLRRFLRCFFDENQDALGFYSLLFILFLWPVGGWLWSGFINFNSLSLGNVLPYPSTFAIAMTFWIFSIYSGASNSKPKALLCGVLTSVVVLSHPTTALFTILGLLSIALHNYKNSRCPSFVAWLLVISVAAPLTLLWPYYSFRDLITANNPGVHQQSVSLYSDLVVHTWPVIVLLPFALILLASRLTKNRCDAISLMLASAILIYILGYTTGLYGVGRIVSFVAILVQIVIATQLIALESKLRTGKARFIAVTLPALFVLAALQNNNVKAFERAFEGFRGSRFSYERYESLAKHVGQYDLILADLQTSWKLPSFSGKVIASKHPAHWVEDEAERRSDLSQFFSSQVDPTKKFAIIRRYRPDYILINRRAVQNTEPYSKFGSRVYENDRFILLKSTDLSNESR